MNFISQFILAVLKTKSSNLADIATAFSGRSKVESHYDRIRAFFREFQFSQEEIAMALMAMLNKIPDQCFLVMDRTNWKFGQTDINLLTLGILHKGVVFPVFHCPLDKRGNSNLEERKSIILRFIRAFGRPQMLHLVADREFIGTEWLTFLTQFKIQYCIRIRENTKIPNKKGKLRNAKTLFLNLPRQKYECLGRRTAWFQKVYVIGGKNVLGQYCILLCSHQPELALNQYAQRWKIESFFGYCKTKGFNFESTHLTDLSRVSRLFSLMTLIICLANKVGLLLDELKPIRLKAHLRKAESYFHLGLKTLRCLALQLNDPKKFHEYYELIKKSYGT